MTTFLSGPMFEQAQSGVWRSDHKKSGAHYNTYSCLDKDGMHALRQLFPKGLADEMNFVLFSTSGVHGMYTTIEEAEDELKEGTDEDGEPVQPSVTFLIMQPRIVCVRYGNCLPRTAEDFEFLKKLRHSSWAAVMKIGRSDD